MAEAGEPLTERELEVVRLLATGASNKEIASALSISPNTVKVHLRNVFVKLEADSRTGVTMTAVRNGWVAGGPIPASDLPPADPQLAELIAPAPAGSDEAAPTAQVISVGAPIPAPPVSVRVAPNPLPLPKLGYFRRASMVLGIAVTLLAAAIAVPAREPASASSPITLRQENAAAGSGLRFPGENTRWFERTRLPAPREFASAASVGDQIYLIGGVVSALATGDVMIYDLKSNTWATGGAPKPTAVGIASASAIGTRVYVSGGMLSNDTPTNRFEVLDTESGTWTTLAALPLSLAGHASAALGDRIYVMGGYSPAGLNVDTFAYDPRTNTWQRRAAMPTPRGLLAAAALGNQIYVVGGQTDGQERSDCEAYAPAEDVWTACARMTLRRSAFGLAASTGALYAVGGGGTTYLGFSERYDPVRNAWTLFETPKLGDWRNIGMAPIRSGVLVAGGRNGADRLRDTFVFELGGNRAFLPALTQQQVEP
ncbi:MAG TPA: kelch repeat-containing protein [Thermoflexales bacterium]|nr:kelch repeat-containing protein [Thermoflexales bacterium]